MAVKELKLSYYKRKTLSLTTCHLMVTQFKFLRSNPVYAKMRAELKAAVAFAGPSKSPLSLLLQGV